MHFIDVLRSRGLIQDVSDAEGIKHLGPGDSAYVGFDPTAPSLQLGNLVSLVTALHLGQLGLKPILLFGGATAAIGDPSGKKSERVLLDIETVAANKKRIETKVVEICDRMRVKPAFVNNYDWTKDIGVIEFLRDVGKHFTVNYMLAKETVKTRLDGDGISFTEFSYMLLQSYDFLHLHQTYKCRLQFGGSDQWGNITAGLELIRRKLQAEVFAFCTPLITDSQGRKFGKSEGGALYLDGTMTSPYKLHQFLLNVEDASAIHFLRVFTFLTDDQIAEIEKAFKAGPEKREAQRALADAVCALVHGEAATAEAKKSAEVLFGGSIQGLNETQLEDIFAEVPSSEVKRKELAALTVADIFVTSGLSKSKGEAKKLAASGGVYINNERIPDALTPLNSAPLGDRRLFVLRSGKKNYHLVRIAD